MDHPKLAPADKPEGGRSFLLIFTDLDGTILDQEDYAFDHAHPAPPEPRYSRQRPIQEQD